MKKSEIIIAGIVILSSFFIFLYIKNNSRAVGACYSSDGINIEKAKKIAGLFGGSSGIILKDGTILLGGLDFLNREGIEDKETGFKLRGVGFLISKDGWNFSRFKLGITNLNRDIIAYGDPTIIQLPNGDYRMYFTEKTTEQYMPDILMSAYSKDGYNYRFEGKITGESNMNLTAVDFTAFYEKNTKKYYIYTRSDNFDEAEVLESEDGRHFAKRFKIKIPFGFQFSIINEKDYYVAYGRHIPSDNKPDSNLRYPVKAISKDGLHWERTKEQPIGPWQRNRTYCDTYAVFKLFDGYYFY
ncbi:hypothetical protein KJ671_00130 [Patescibacteria group bacterium]|nr:hypothetical protein [Patescibacteria group bacterium]